MRKGMKILIAVLIIGAILLSGCIGNGKKTEVATEMQFGAFDQSNRSCTCKDGQTPYGPFKDAQSCNTDCDKLQSKNR